MQKKSRKRTMKEKMVDINKEDKLQSFLSKISKEELYSSLQNTYAQLSTNNEELLECIHLLYPITREGYEVMVLKVNEDSDTLWECIMTKVDELGNPVEKPLFKYTYEVESSIPAVCTINSILMNQLKSRMLEIENPKSK